MRGDGIERLAELITNRIKSEGNPLVYENGVMSNSVTTQEGVVQIVLAHGGSLIHFQLTIEAARSLHRGLGKVVG